MAAADLLAGITAVALRRMSYYFPGSFLDIYFICNVVFVLLCASRDCSVWFTVTFTIDRFVAICCQNLKTKYCSEKTAAVVLATAGIMFFLKNIPFYFIFAPGEVIDNIPWFCDVKKSFYTEPGWVGFVTLDEILTPLLPFIVILLLNALTVRHILLSSQVRKRLKGQNKGENRIDPEMESRKKSMVLLFALSGSFILLWMWSVMGFLYYNIAGTNPKDYNVSEYIFAQVAYMLQNLSLCTNTFIYGVTQAKFREQFKVIMKYPVTRFLQLIYE